MAEQLTMAQEVQAKVETFKPLTKYTICVGLNTSAQTIRDKVEAFIRKDPIARHVFRKAMQGVKPAWEKGMGYHRYVAEVTEAASKVVRVIYKF